MTRRCRVTLTIAAFLGLIQPRSALASSIDITLDTTALTTAPGVSNGPFSLFFQLTDGSGLDDGNNTVTLESFAFGGGSPSGSATLDGGAADNLGSAVFLTDSSFFNSFTQGFTPGGLLSFRLSMTTNVDAGGTPDAFAFSILDAAGFPIASLDPTLADSLLTFNFDSSSPSLLTYGTDPQRTNILMSAPGVEPTASAVPEPASITLLTTGVAAIWGRRRRHEKRP